MLLTYISNTYYTNPMFGKNLVPEIRAKMLSGNQIVKF